jgi:hypothetical protein
MLKLTSFSLIALLGDLVPLLAKQLSSITSNFVLMKCPFTRDKILMDDK